MTTATALATAIAFHAARADETTLGGADAAQTSGYTEYIHSCAACHGLDGAGDGPLASALVAQPSDLTGLAERNGGVFPFERVKETIASGGDILSHGSGEMPVWRETFRSHLSPVATEELLAALARHLERIQR